VDHDTGGTDALRVVDSDGNGVDDVTIRAYLTTDYESSTYTVQGTTYTGTDGRWVAPLYLDVGVYTLVFEADDFVINTTTVTVS
jgi:5-hydroxyisourate hydrolase-like protein (transthyretin family)